MSDLEKIATESAHATSAVGVLLIHAVSLLARQPGFDARRFADELEALTLPDDAAPSHREVYEGLKKTLLANLREP